MILTWLCLLLVNCKDHNTTQDSILLLLTDIKPEVICNGELFVSIFNREISIFLKNRHTQY